MGSKDLMHLQGEGSGTAAAEELVAEEANEAAKEAPKAAAKKQKQRAKAPKQQRLSDATPTSEPASITRLQKQLGMGCRQCSSGSHQFP